MASMRSTVKTWFPLIRPFTLTAAVIPVLVGGALAAWKTDFYWSRLVALAMCAILIQAATNMFNEYFDHARGLDDHESVGIAGSIVQGHLSPRTVMTAAIVTLLLALAFGVYLVWVVSPWLLLLGGISVLGAFVYSGGPRPVAWTPFGEFEVFLLMGLLLVGLSYYVHGLTIPLWVLLAGVPLSLLVAAILLGNNIRDMAGDAQKGRRTLAIVWGRDGGIWLLAALLAGSFLMIVVAVAAGAAPVWALLALLSIPLAPPIIQLFRATTVPMALHPAVKGIARLHLVQGMLFTLGVVLATVQP